MIFGGIAELMKEVRETADFLLKLPDKLAAMVMQPQESYLTRKQRIAKLKEVAEIREIGKTLGHMFIMKGGALEFLDRIDRNPREEDVAYLKSIFDHVIYSLEELKSTIHDTSLASSALASEASIFISRAITTYRALQALPTDTLADSGNLREISETIINLERASRSLLERLDGYRSSLEGTYGE